MKLAVGLSLVLCLLMCLTIEDSFKLLLLSCVVGAVNIVFIVLASVTEISVKKTIIVTNILLAFLIINNYQTLLT